jgi:ATP-dependent DNA ligase
MPPVAPMLARATRQVPVGDFLYEPKWDGFRCLIFRDGDEVELGSRGEKSLTRYFPEIVAGARRELPERCVLDGELVVAGPSGLDFDLLSQRIHPAASRVERLTTETPAAFVAFDILALGDEDLRTRPFAERRHRLEEALATALPPLRITPITSDPAVAADWFRRFEGAGLDGVVAKSTTLEYRPDQRVMWKIKHERTGDFVVGGFRWYAADRSVVGSLMLGLYEGDTLHHVGVIGAFPAEQRRQLVAALTPFRDPVDHPWADWAAVAGHMPAALGHRWNVGKDLSFEPLRPELVVEAAFEHLQGRRIRHTARFRRWRPDRDPRSCTYSQLEVAVPALLSEVFGAKG